MLVECSVHLKILFVHRQIREDEPIPGAKQVQHIYNNTEAMSLLAVRLRMRPLYNLVFCFLCLFRDRTGRVFIII